MWKRVEGLGKEQSNIGLEWSGADRKGRKSENVGVGKN
jgi:hypothetical protein